MTIFSSVLLRTVPRLGLKNKSYRDTCHQFQFLSLIKLTTLMSTNCTESIRQPDWIVPKPEKELAQLKVFNSMTRSLVNYKFLSININTL